MSTAWLYLLREFGRAMALCVGAFVGLYLAVDFFERLPTFLGRGAPFSLIAKYFLLKIPLIMSQVIPGAVLAASLLSLGQLARSNELMAMRACGISLVQIATPILVCCTLLGLGIFVWGETLVPAATFRAHFIERVQIKQRAFRGLFAEFEIWLPGPKSFTHIERVDSRRQEIYGVTRYELDDEFAVTRALVAPVARWSGSEWLALDGHEIHFGLDGSTKSTELVSKNVGLIESPEDLTAVHHDPDDLSFRDLRREIKSLRRKGIDATNETVQLWLKPALPYVCVIMALIAVPLASHRSRSSSFAASVGTAITVGFAYWVILALTTSLGNSGVLPAPVAAWTANGIFTLVGIIFFLSAE